MSKADTGSPGSGELSLDQMLVRIGSGDHALYRTLHDVVAPAVLRVIVRVLRDPHQAEEVSQDVLTEIWQRAPLFDPVKGTAVTWIMTVARARAIDRVRQSQRTRERDHLYTTSNFQRAVETITEHLDEDAQVTLIRSALLTLTPVQREAVLLNHLHGFTQTEVAALLDVPLGTVKSRIRDGLIRLRAYVVGHL